MSLTTRQQTLFASENWKMAYRAYSEINFQAYDYDTIRASLVDYVRLNHPETFNDFIESSEFIAIIELLAYLSQSLAFRMDVNTRENFLETAERKSSVFKLARMLGYNPMRNRPATGLVKVVSVKTTQLIQDSQGNALNNQEVFWNDANNPLSYEQFIMIMNAAMSKVNRFSSPAKSGRVNDVLTESYHLNTPATSPLAYTFNTDIQGSKRTFNIVNPDFQDHGAIYERHPDPANLFTMLYRNNGHGIGSDQTGFFMMFRQGTLQFQDYDFTEKVPSRVQNVAVPNINEDDVYLQRIDSQGKVLSKWTRVPNLVGQTLAYNDASEETKDLYVVHNDDNNGIRLIFTDGNFANIPTGIFRLWYRVSDPEKYVIYPENMRNFSITIPYQDVRGQDQKLTVKFSLNHTVNNSMPAESLENIKKNAPQVYYTQNRMVNGADYNTLPRSLNTNIRKIKAINRTHAGHSRYIEVNDPTGMYHDVDVFATDGYMYVENQDMTTQIIVGENRSALDVVTADIPVIMKSQQFNNFIYHEHREQLIRYNANYFNLKFTASGHPTNYVWHPLPEKSQAAVGYITEDFSAAPARSVMVNYHPDNMKFQENNFIKWQDPQDPSKYVWSRIVRVRNHGELHSGLATSQGPWTLSTQVPSGYQATQCVISARKIFTQSEAQAMVALINQKRSFGLSFQAHTNRWIVLTQDLVTDTEWKPHEVNAAASWHIKLDYQPLDARTFKYVVTHRATEYVFQSANELKFFNVKSHGGISKNSDTVSFTTLNSQPGTTETQYWNLQNQGRGPGYWENDVTGYRARPSGYVTQIPMPSRDIQWHDVKAEWNSNFGILDASMNQHDIQDISVVDRINRVLGVNQYVAETNVGVNTYYQDGDSVTASGNLIIQSHTGMIQSLPNTLNIPYDTNTFGADFHIVDSQGCITYRQFNKEGTELHIFHGDHTGVISYGPQGNSPDPDHPGRIQIKSHNLADGSGVLVYTNLTDNVFHYSTDSTGIVSQDKLVLNYDKNTQPLTEAIHWVIHDVYEYSDGFVDPSKVKVKPMDTDGDLVPDRPLQFHDYVGRNNVVIFHKYTDFDGYVYNKPIDVQDSVWDLRFQGGTTTQVYPNRRDLEENQDYVVGDILYDDANDTYYEVIVDFHSYQDSLGEILRSRNVLRQLDSMPRYTTGVIWDPELNTLTPANYHEPRDAGMISWILVRNFGDVVRAGSRGLENNQGGLNGIRVYTEFSWTSPTGEHYPAGAVYVMTASSTDPTMVTAQRTHDFYVAHGRGIRMGLGESGIVKWKHISPSDTRLDPSISNVIENIVLTETHYDAVQDWLVNNHKPFPRTPTSSELSVNFHALDEYKCASDTMIYRSAEFLRLFGKTSEPKYQAYFKVVKLDARTSDSEIKSMIITAMNNYFNVDHWDFGDTFYFTEMASYIHQQLGGKIGSIVIVPMSDQGVHDSGFQVQAKPTQLFLNTATVDDIHVINQKDAQALSPLRS